MFLREGVIARLVVLSLLAATGMALVVYHPGIGGEWPGVVLTLAGIALCAAYTVIARRFVAVSDSTSQVVLAQQAYALALAVIAVGAVGWLGGDIAPMLASPVGVLSAVGSGVLYYAAAYWFYLSALRRVPASQAATSFYLIPVFGVTASLLVLGERLDVRQWLGVAIVLLAFVAIARLSSRVGVVQPALAATRTGDSGQAPRHDERARDLIG